VRYRRLGRTKLGNGKLPKPRTSSKKRAESQPSGAPPENEDRPLSGKKLGRNRSILRSGRHISRTKQWRRTFVAVPWCTLVSDHNDPSIGAMTPFRKLYTLSDRVCPRQMTKVRWRRFRKCVRRLFVFNSLPDFSLQLLYISFLERFVGRTEICAQLSYSVIQHQ
jgi:hypothetical protein